MAHYFITGHTGFKGAWLIFLLKSQGHEVSGLALDPLPGSIFDRTDLANDLVYDFRADIRNREETIEAVRTAKPDYLIHMAAQALVGDGYREPRYTYETNVTGTLNVLEAADRTDSIQAQLIVTTDKVYQNLGLNRPFVETDPLGGKDPYSASKAMADIVSQEYFSRNRSKPGAVARAGNVIGAGDVAKERLIPDLVRAIEYEKPLMLRYPDATRPWQHVLDCLNGYLLLLRQTSSSQTGGVWNFGPSSNSPLSVRDVVARAESALGTRAKLYEGNGPLFQEAQSLTLNSHKAETELSWANLLSSQEAIDWAAIRIADTSRARIERDIEMFNAKLVSGQDNSQCASVLGD